MKPSGCKHGGAQGFSLHIVLNREFIAAKLYINQKIEPLLLYLMQLLEGRGIRRMFLRSAPRPAFHCVHPKTADSKILAASFVQGMNRENGCYNICFVFLRILLLMLSLSVLACENTTLARAQREAASGHYLTAHELYQSAMTQAQQLSPLERQKAADGICLTEYLVGAPTYPLMKQYKDCMAAAASPNSSSKEIASKVAARLREAIANEVDDAIKRRDMSGAVMGVLKYQSIEGADQARIKQWSARIWSMVQRLDRQQRAPNSRRSTTQVPRLLRAHSNVRGLSRQRFEQWVTNHAPWHEASGYPIAKIQDKTLSILLPKSDLPLNSQQLEQLANINDAFAVWCRCNAKTAVEVEQWRLPAYVLHIDPATGHSEVIVLVER